MADGGIDFNLFFLMKIGIHIIGDFFGDNFT